MCVDTGGNFDLHSIRSYSESLPSLSEALSDHSQFEDIIMTTRPQPNNATPQRLQLGPQRGPRMPFSSPMGEEILSPTSPHASRSSPKHQIKLSQSRARLEDNTKEKWVLPSQRPTPGERKASHENGDSKSKWPGLNVVTNFAKAPIIAQKGHEEHAKQDAGLGLKKEAGGLIATSRKPSVETLGLGHQQSGRSLKSLGSKGRLGDLKRASSKWSTLSPSDRAVVIGISISPEELAKQSASPEASPAKPDGLTEQHAIIRGSPNMPMIVVTPAKEKAPWSEEEDPVQIQQRRIASSVYSQMPTPDTSGRYIDSTIVPPIPPLPPDAQKHYASNQSQVFAKKGPPPRIMSTCTDIDEGESPGVRDEYRPGTGDSQLRILTNKGSMDTLATRHRSEGWWNHIISPFFPKSPMTFKASPHPRELTPGASGPSHATRQDQSLQEARQTFPPPPNSDGLKSGHTSWTDSDVDIDLEKKRLELDGFHDRSTLIMDEAQEDPMRESALLPTRFEGFGLAAEYHEACLYDMYSPTPYYECQNHICLPYKVVPAEFLGAEHDDARGFDEGKGFGPAAEPEAPRIAEQPHNFAAQQAPMNRFSAAFHEAMTPRARERPMSDSTAIEDLDATPDVQEAHAAPIVRAPAPVPAAQPPIPAAEHESEPPPEPEPKPAQSRGVEEPPQAPAAVPHATPAPAYSPPRQERAPKRYVAVLPPEQPQRAYEQPISPGPLSPGQQRQGPSDAILLNEVDRNNSGSHPAFGQPRTMSYQRHREPDQTTVADLYPPPRDASRDPRRLDIGEKDALPQRSQKEHRPLTVPRCRTCFSGSKPQSKKRKWILMAIAAGLILMIILVLVLVMTLTGKSDKTPIQSNWLNLTNFPPIPTGVSTIVQPNAVTENPSCVQPATMWSCAVPKEQQQGLQPNAPNQPNFRVEIVFQNGTNATTNTTVAGTSAVSRRSYGHVANAVSAGGFVRDRLLRIRSAFSSDQYTPSPAPPSLEDRTFLGNTTDKNAAPFDGEYTPFFMSFESAIKISSRRLKRRTSNPDGSTVRFGDITKAIPPPDSNPDGTAAAANLHPFPTAQPLRLYDRGLDTEHYGFYTYFDRSIFLKSAAPLTDAPNTTSVPDDENGGADENAAAVRCTWAQTRFLVQIWTKKGDSATLLTQQPANSTSPSPSSNATTLTTSSANNFTQPGSFPYPITITLDRHGGALTQKMVYCYGLDDREHINATQKLYQLEDRGVGGQLVNPALGPFGDVNVTAAQGGPGGVDGGSGGCECKWQNFGTGV